MRQDQSALQVSPDELTAQRPHASFPAGLSLDRDLSLIEFHRRVLDEARDQTNPLLERVRFLGIVGTIVDEFAVTRGAKLAGGISHASDAAHLQRIEAEVRNLLEEAHRHLREELAPALAREGIHLVDEAQLTEQERAEIQSHFTSTVLPLLMPLGFDAARPFPHISGRSVALAVVLRGAGKEHLAFVQVPDSVPALVPFHWCRRTASVGPSALEQGFVWLDEVIAANLAAVFPGMDIVQVHGFRVFRNEGLDYDVSPGGVLRDAVERGLRHREFGDVIATLVRGSMPAWLVELLGNRLAIRKGAIQTCNDLTNLARLGELCRIDRSDLREPPRTPRVPSELAPACPGRDILSSIRQGDILLHHPYESFQPVIDFFEQAASDPDVLAISTTLYRVGRNSPIVDALLAAVRARKQVRVVVELRARFDEQHNIAWSRALEDAGAHVVYGMVDFKVHAKLTLIVRRESGRLRRYVHLSSGNYNGVTSEAYTDLGLFSCNESLGRDATDLFNFLTGYSSPSAFRTLLVAPMTLRRGMKALIERESSWAQRGGEARLILKMNSLADPDIIESLYRASQAGVRVDLIVRGICCLRPGVPGVSDRIRVRSIVGRFLEHSRAWYFHNGGHEEVYLGSADALSRNLDERVEVMVRIDDLRLKQRVLHEILTAYLADNVKARELAPDGSYARVARRPEDSPVNSQESL